MQRIIGTGLCIIGIWWCAGWGQPTVNLDLLSREQLQQQKDQLKQQKASIHSVQVSSNAILQEVNHFSKGRRLLQTHLPQAPLLGATALVKIEDIQRVDEEVLRAYPDSPPQLHYYELQARVLKIWREEWYAPYYGKKPLRVRSGDVLSLLWIACKRSDDGTEIPTPSTWKKGHVYLVYDLAGVSKRGAPLASPDPEAKNWLQSVLLGDYWWVLDVPDCRHSPRARWSSSYDILRYLEFSPYSSVLQTSDKPTSYIESPPEELLQVLDEEAIFYRLPEQRSVQLAWVKQRAQDTSLPLWKRQRALVYWFASDRGYEEVPASRQPVLYVQQQIDYLAFLRHLQEPAMQAYGLYVMATIEHNSYEAPYETVEQWLEALEPFLANERPLEVRRQASAVLWECIVSRASWKDDRQSWLRYADSARRRWEQESDPVVKAYLGKVWTFILRMDIDDQMEIIDRLLRGRG